MGDKEESTSPLKTRAKTGHRADIISPKGEVAETSTQFKTISQMSGAYQESLPHDGSAATSLSSQMNHYDSDLRSSSQPATENTFYQDGSQYPPPHGVQHEQLHYAQEDFHDPLLGSSMPRSNPIAIQRSSSDGYREVDSDDDNDHEDENSDIDVEGDAIKLQRKYGSRVIQTYVPDATILQTSSTRRRHSSSVLDAPYLGSLSKSSNQVLSLPPMSLAGDSDFLGEPPQSIATSYGSLRDSHERGRFLDGPSSYREPSSGKIRQLDHRLRYQTRQPPELNIGERLQQSLKSKELRLKKEKSNNNGNNDERKETASSLSAMMDEASKNGNTPPRGDGNFISGSEHLVPIQDKYVTSPYRERPLMSSNMLSTSMTAFELLKSSNSSTSNPPYSSKYAASDARPAMNFAKSPGFQPLSRSMSDPSPRLQSLSLSDSKGQTMPTIGLGLAAQMANFEQSGTHQVQAPYFDGRDQRSPQHLDHDPNTDGAFGDMDM